MSRNHKAFASRERRLMNMIGLIFGLGVWGFGQSGVTGEKVLATFEGGQVTQAMAEEWLNFLRWDKDKINDPVFLEGLALSLTWFQEAKKAGLMEERKLQDLWVADRGAFCKRSLLSNLAEGIRIEPGEVAARVATGEYAGREEKVRIRQIFKKYPDQATQTQKQALIQKMVALQGRVRNGESFTELAGKESESQTRFRGGLIGNVGRGDLDPRVEKVLFALKDGEVSDPFLTKEGAMLFWCEKRISAKSLKAEEQRDLATKALKKEKIDTQWQGFVEAEQKKLVIFWARFAEKDPMTVLAKIDQLTLTRQEIGDRLANEVDEVQDPWTVLPKQKLQAQIERLALDHVFCRRFETVRDTKRPDWKEALKWAEIKFWSLKFLEREVGKVFKKPDEAEITAYYKAHLQKYQRKPYFDLSLIGLHLDKDNLRSQTELSKLIEAEVTSGRLTFEEAAKKYSELPSAKQGGQLGWVPRFRIAGIGKEFLRVVDRIQPGQVGPWVRQDQVLYWAMVHAKQPARNMTLDEARPRVLRQIANGKLDVLQRQVEDQWSEKIHFQLVK